MTKNKNISECLKSREKLFTKVGDATAERSALLAWLITKLRPLDRQLPVNQKFVLKFNYIIESDNNDWNPIHLVADKID